MARRSGAKASPRVIRSGPKGGRYLVKNTSPSHKYSRVYVKQCKGSAARGSKGMRRVVHVGPRGGKYCIVNGEKRYIK